MNFLKTTVSLIILIVLFQCASSRPKLETNLPFEIGAVYYQNWDTSAHDGRSGMNIVISMLSNPKKVLLDSVYFRGEQAKLKHKNNLVYIGEFKTHSTVKNEIIMSIEPYAEYGNKAPKITKMSRFQLEADECVISYKKANKVRYFKIDNIRKN